MRCATRASTKGPSTHAALAAFQRAHGLPATGSVDRVTLEKLGLEPARLVPARYAKPQLDPAERAEADRAEAQARARTLQSEARPLRAKARALRQKAKGAKAPKRGEALKEALQLERQAAQDEFDASLALAAGHKKADEDRAQHAADAASQKKLAAARYELDATRAQRRRELSLAAAHLKAAAILTDKSKAEAEQRAVTDHEKAAAALAQTLRKAEQRLRAARRQLRAARAAPPPTRPTHSRPWNVPNPGNKE